MAASRETDLRALEPNLQVSFYYKLQTLKTLYLHEGLSSTVSQIPLALLDEELARYAPQDSLSALASKGLRGELVFPVPCLLSQSPYLLGYYRLLYGFSQKELYGKRGYGRFSGMEVRGDLGAARANQLPALCHCLCRTGAKLIAALDDCSLCILHDLQLLTVGPQLRGSENTRIGQSASKCVFDLIRGLVESWLVETTLRTLIIRNASGRRVMVEFASDPDVSIIEKLPTDVRRLVSMEIKGGKDVSNIHNRLGEAEKSHQKARARGFFEFWTIINVPMTLEAARMESPTTGLLFMLDDILAPSSSEHARFRDLLASVIGIRTGGTA